MPIIAREISETEIYHKVKLIDPSFALDFFKDIRQFEMFMKERNEDECLEYNLSKRYTNEELEKLISSFTIINNLSTLDIETRDKMLKNIKRLLGASNRQLSRVLNIGRGIFDKIK